MRREVILQKVHATLEHIRPYLQNDGGDVEFVDLSEERVVYVRLIGACVGCQHSHMTLNNGIREALLRDIPEIRDVIAIQPEQ